MESSVRNHIRKGREHLILAEEANDVSNLVWIDPEEFFPATERSALFERHF